MITRYPAEELLVAGGSQMAVGGQLSSARETQSNLNRASAIDAVVASARLEGAGES